MKCAVIPAIVVSTFLLLPQGRADEADDMVERLAKKHNFLCERVDLDRGKPIWKLGIQRASTKQNAEEVRSILQQLPNLKGLRYLYFTDARIRDSVLKAVGQCKGIELLDLGGNPITAEGLKELAGLDKLKTLSLAGVAISDDALKHISQIKNLEYLKITNTRITGKGFEDLAGMQKLKTIEATDSPLAAGYHLQLAKIKSLEAFFPSGRITQADVDELRKLNPRIQVAGFANKPVPTK